jgi:hypothetical protein
MKRARCSNTSSAGKARASPPGPGQTCSLPSTATPMSAAFGTCISVTGGITLRGGWFQ